MLFIQSIICDFIILDKTNISNINITLIDKHKVIETIQNELSLIDIKLNKNYNEHINEKYL